MSFQELKKKEKGKEIVTSEENPTTSEVSMYFSEQGIAAILEANKKDNAEMKRLDCGGQATFMLALSKPLKTWWTG
ncbi:hypothetical protein Bca52824_026763 [Brassica carinata]|uniref:Uncharacterized protein n=1 Tax=Brassica carinata TaxID=52824 RepID=A0A8X7SK44_BRACI|nr:hypothetical protein Bca52824_026763 [Brassica carinata]